MKPLIMSITIAVGMGFAGNVMSADMPEIAKKLGCNACHSIDKKVVGPAWQAVADKYKGATGAADMLNAKIAKGGGGVWGAIPMPPQIKATDADRKDLVAFILGLAK